MERGREEGVDERDFFMDVIFNLIVFASTIDVGIGGNNPKRKPISSTNIQSQNGEFIAVLRFAILSLSLSLLFGLVTASQTQSWVWP